MKIDRRFALAWALVVCLLLAHNAYLWLGQRIVPDTDILALLPVQERDPVLQSSFTHMVDAAQQRVVVLVGASDWDGARRAADAYRAVLDKHGDLLRQAGMSDQVQDDWLGKFSAHKLTLFSDVQLAQLKTEPPQFWLDAAQSKLYGAFSGPKLGAFQDDPFGLFTGWVQERAQETPVRPRDGVLFVGGAGRDYVLLPLTLQVPALSMTAQQSVLPALAAAKAAALAAAPQTEVITAGVVLHAAAASKQASGEVSTIGIGSLLGIVLLMWLTFGSLRPIALILLSIGIGCLGALSLSYLFFERIHLMTLVFGASLIGVAQDYGLYFLCQRLNAGGVDSPTLLRRLFPGLGLTLLTTVIGYMGLALTPFPGLRQMALFSALGLVFAWFTVVFWFPMLIGPQSLSSGALVRINSAVLLRWPRLRMNVASLVALVVLGGLAAAGCARLGANDDIRLLQNPPKDLVADQIKLSKLLDAPTPVQYYLVRGDSQQTVLTREEALKRRLDPLIASHAISAYQALSNWVPSQRAQDERRALVEQALLQPGGPLDTLAKQIDEGQEWADATRTRLRAAGAPLTLDAYLSWPASEPFRHLWLGKVEGGYASIVALRGITSAGLPQLRSVAAGLDGVQWVDKVGEISSVLGRYRVDMGWVVLASYGVVWLLLLPRYRRQAWRVLAPSVAASVVTLGMLGWLGQDLQLFHVLALMLVLSIGVDYGIFMLEHPDRRSAMQWLTVGLSASSTILSFGLLALSKTPALQAFGLTMLIGVAVSWITVPCFGRETPDEQ